jgi:hypothetical protein
MALEEKVGEQAKQIKKAEEVGEQLKVVKALEEVALIGTL